MLLATFIYIVNLLAMISKTSSSILVNILGSTTVPFIIYVVPGMLFYYHCKNKEEEDEFPESKGN